MPLANPRAKSNKRKQAPPPEICRDPNFLLARLCIDSDNEMPIPQGPLIDGFTVDSSNLEVTPGHQKKCSSHAKTCIRHGGAGTHARHGVTKSSAGTESDVSIDIVDKKPTASNDSNAPQDGRNDSDQYQDGRDNSSDATPQCGPDNLSMAGSSNHPARKKVRSNLPARTPPNLPARTPTAMGKEPAPPANLQKQQQNRLQGTPKSPAPCQALLSPFIEKAPPLQCAYVDDNSDDEGEYGALLRLATTMPRPMIVIPTELPITAAVAAPPRSVIAISDNEAPIASTSAIADTGRITPTPIIVISDDDLPTSVRRSPPTASSSLIAVTHSSPIIISDSDSSEYIASDIDLNDELVALLDQIV